MTDFVHGLCSNHLTASPVNEAIVTGGSVVNTEKVGSKRSAIAAKGEALTICRVPADCEALRTGSNRASLRSRFSVFTTLPPVTIASLTGDAVRWFEQRQSVISCQTDNAN